MPAAPDHRVLAHEQVGDQIARGPVAAEGRYVRAELQRRGRTGRAARGGRGVVTGRPSDGCRPANGFVGCPRPGIACGDGSVAPSPRQRRVGRTRRAWSGERVGCLSPTQRAATTSQGFAVLWVAIKREPWIFTLSTIGSLLFGALTVADAWVLGWSTDHVLLPAFENGEIDSGLLVAVLALFLGVALLRAVGIVARRLGAGDHAVPHAGAQPPCGHPPVPLPADGVAPAPPDRRAALQRQLRRRGRLGPDRAAADGGRHRRDDGDRGRADVRRRPGAGRGRAARLPGGDRRQPRLPAARLAADDPRPGAARRGQRDRPRVVRRRDGGQDPGPRGRGDRPVRGQGPRAARRQHPRRPDPRGVRPHPGRAAQPRRPVVLAVGVSRVLNGATRGRRRGHRRLPAHHRLVPDPLDRLAAR